MNFAYFRKSSYSLDKTIKNTEKFLQKDWKKLGEANLPDGQGKMILICKPEWVAKVIKENYLLLGFLPCSITIFKKGNDVLIGTGQPDVMKALSQTKDMIDLATKAEIQIKELIHKAAGVDELKPSIVKLYSTMTCPYCKMEKSWLEQNKIKHDVVYVDLNPEEAQKMVDKTGQMGVPVTEIQYDEGEAEFIVGFDKPRLEQLLNLG